MGPKALLAAVSADRYPAQRNEAYTLDRPVSPEDIVTTYNNFFEFGSHKQISKAAQLLPIDPWNILIDGMVEDELELGFEDLVKQVQLEERLYRHRCVEAWAMAVPWTGFPMSRLLKSPSHCPAPSTSEWKPSSTVDCPGPASSWYPWPYEGLTMAEAMNELAFIGTGVYGKPMPKQMGAPIRLVAPWKYGFKSIKSIVRFTFTDERPVNFWEELQSKSDLGQCEPRGRSSALVPGDGADAGDNERLRHSSIMATKSRLLIYIKTWTSAIVFTASRFAPLRGLYQGSLDR